MPKKTDIKMQSKLCLKQAKTTSVRLMLAQKRPLTISDVHTMLSDHATSPESICLHNQAEWSFIEQGESIASIIFDVTEGTIDIADGPPCQYAYQRHNLDHLL